MNKIKKIKVSTKSITTNTFPLKYVCPRQGGKDLVPNLSWDAIPGAKSYALVSDDPDAPYPGGFVHWVVQYIPSNVTQLPVMKPASSREFKINDFIVNKNNNNKKGGQSNKNGKLIQGVNGFGRYAYGGPCPPPDGKAHRYFFRVYALDTVLKKGNQSNQFVTRNHLMYLMKNHILGYGELMKSFKNTTE